MVFLAESSVCLIFHSPVFCGEMCTWYGVAVAVDAILLGF